MRIALRIAALLLACASFPLAAAERRDNRPVSGFDALALSAPVDVVIVQGDKEALALEGDEADLAEIETVVESGTLKIRPRSRWGTANFKSHLRGTLNVKNVRSLAIDGSGDIKSAALHGTDLGIAISGSGDVRIATASYANVSISISGSGDVTVGGKTEKFGAHIAGSGDVRAGALDAREVKVSIAGSGDATVWAREQLHVSIVGAGDVRYFGDPAIKQSVVDSGSVKRAKGSPS